MSPANDRLRARDGRSTLQQRRRPTRIVNVASIASPASVPFIDYNAARPVEDVATLLCSSDYIMMERGPHNSDTRHAAHPWAELFKFNTNFG
jgi:hypothetical protein